MVRSMRPCGGSVPCALECWVSSDWGLGVAGQFVFASIPDGGADSDATWTSISGSVLFSATLN